MSTCEKKEDEGQSLDILTVLGVFVSIILCLAWWGGEYFIYTQIKSNPFALFFILLLTVGAATPLWVIEETYSTSSKVEC